MMMRMIGVLTLLSAVNAKQLANIPIHVCEIQQVIIVMHTEIFHGSAVPMTQMNLMRKNSVSTAIKEAALIRIMVQGILLVFLA